jgi:molecular chaperone GrpE
MPKSHPAADDAQANVKASQSQSTEIHVESSSHQMVTDTPEPNDQTAELTADLQRLQAEFLNFKRRTESERTELTAFAKAQIVRQFLTVRDTFDAEATHRPADFDASWASSIDAIRAQFDSVLKSLGVERFESVGQPFDPHRHEAVASEGSGEVVTAELASGYQLGETILRPAMVKVGPAVIDPQSA